MTNAGIDLLINRWCPWCLHNLGVGRIRQVEEGNWMQLDTVKQWKVVDIITKLLGLKNATFESANPTTAKLTNLQSLPFHFTFAHPVLEHCAVCHTGALCSADRMHPGLKGRCNPNKNHHLSVFCQSGWTQCGLHHPCNPKVLQGTKHSHSHATATSAFRPSSKGHALCEKLRSSVAPLPAHPHRCNKLLVAAPLRPCAQAWSASWTSQHQHTARRSYAPRPWPRCVPSSPFLGQSHLGCQCPRTSGPDFFAPQAVWTLLLPMMSLWHFAPRPAGDVGKFQGFNVRWCFGLLSHGFMTLVLHYTDVATCELNHIALVLGGLFTAMMT